MSYYSKGMERRGDDEDVDDFDEYDPTPYGGGYDLVLTFGRPLPPSEEICYPPCSSSTGIDYERPNYSSSQAAYADEADFEGRYGYSRPKPPSDPASEEGYRRPAPNYGFQPGMNRPGYGGSEYGHEESEELGGRPKREEYGFESGRPGHYGDDHPPPRRQEEGRLGGYGFESGRSGRYGDEYPPPGRQEEGGVGGYGLESDRPGSYGDDYPPPKHKEEEGGGNYGFGFQKNEEYGFSGRSEEPTHGRVEYEAPAFERPSYGRQQYEEPPKPTYGRQNYEVEEPERYQETGHYNPDQGEGYSSRPKYGDDSDDEEKKHRHHKHHHRKHSDDE